LFEGTGNVVQESANLFWDNTNGRLGIGTSTPNVPLEVNGSAIIQTLTIGLGKNAIASNTALGYQALNANTSGSVNTAVGYQALLAITSGSNNTAVGVNALSAVSYSADNTAVGVRSLQSLNNAGQNVAIGFQTLQTNLSGAGNCGIGHNALNLTKGSNNVAIGLSAGQANTTGANNIFIGASSTGVSATESNRTWIGNATTATTWLAGNVLINTTTDAGFKLDVNGTARFSGQVNITTNTTIGTDGTITNTYLRNAFSACFGAVAYAPASVVLECRSTTQGFLPPRMTTTQKNAIATPAEGLQVWDTTLKLMSVYNGTTWITL
jgi:hypothetical protein